MYVAEAEQISMGIESLHVRSRICVNEPGALGVCMYAAKADQISMGLLRVCMYIAEAEQISTGHVCSRS